MLVRRLILNQKVETPGHVQTSRDVFINIDVATDNYGVKIPCKLKDGTAVDQFVPWSAVKSMMLDKAKPAAKKPTE